MLHTTNKQSQMVTFLIAGHIILNKKSFAISTVLWREKADPLNLYTILHVNDVILSFLVQLVEGMQEEGILRALGSQPVPVRSDGVRVSHDLPATGNMLEMQDWKPPSYHTVLLQKQGKRFTSTAPSQR